MTKYKLQVNLPEWLMQKHKKIPRGRLCDIYTETTQTYQM